MADYGSDVHCVDDFLAHMPVVSGRLGVAQACARRLQTPRARFPWWPEYGTDLRQYLLGSASTDDIGAAIEDECEKDERVERATATVIRTDTTVTATVEIQLDEETDPFEFVFVVTQEKTALLVAG